VADVGRRGLAEPEVGAVDHHVDGRHGVGVAAYDRGVVADPADDAGPVAAGEGGADRLDQRQLTHAASTRARRERARM
jgi:hypothetical protein